MELHSEIWDDYEINPNNYLLMRSEGSLEKSIWTNPIKNDLTSYTVSIFGDLRNRDDENEIVKWFKDLCPKINNDDSKMRVLGRLLL